MRIVWEEIESDGLAVRCYAGRCKVPGGWFVFVRHSSEEGNAFFYPDPTHKWDGNSLA